jgi:ABC-type multidrug transport system ATPase subunit
VRTTFTVPRSRSPTWSRPTGKTTKTALGGVSFAVGRGEIFGLLGPNGSGKITTVRILVTLLEKTSGAARVGGFDTDRQPGQVRQVIGYAGQSIGVDDDLTAAENLKLGGLLHDLPHDQASKRAAELLDAFSLTEVAGQRAGRPSGGMQRRLDLAQALVHRPMVLFLDEPTTGLNPQSRNALWAQLRRRSREEGVTILLTTQHLEEADRARDRVAIIDQGRLVTIGTPHAMKEEVGGARLVLTIHPRRGRPRAGAGRLPGRHARPARRSWRSSGRLRARRGGQRGAGHPAAGRGALLRPQTDRALTLELDPIPSFLKFLPGEQLASDLAVSRRPWPLRLPGASRPAGQRRRPVRPARPHHRRAGQQRRGAGGAVRAGVDRGLRGTAVHVAGP